MEKGGQLGAIQMVVFFCKTSPPTPLHRRGGKGGV